MKVNWGAVLVDIAILAATAYTRNWWLLCFLLGTGGYQMKEPS